MGLFQATVREALKKLHAYDRVLGRGLDKAQKDLPAIDGTSRTTIISSSQKVFPLPRIARPPLTNLLDTVKGLMPKA